MHELDDDDIALFRSAVGSVKPLTNDRAESEKPLPAATPLQLQRDEEAALEELMSERYSPEALTQGDEMHFHRPGLQHSIMRKLRGGRYRTGDELDLHGMRPAEAKQAVGEFIKDALDRNIRCVRIIHGKGRGSDNRGPVLKPLVAKWLVRRDEVLAFSTARPADGGTGAVYVLLKK